MLLCPGTAPAVDESPGRLLQSMTKKSKFFFTLHLFFFDFLVEIVVFRENGWQKSAWQISVLFMVGSGRKVTPEYAMVLESM